MSRLDRRALFTSGAAAALLAASGLAVAAAPRHGGRLRLAVPLGKDGFDLAVRGAVFETLTEVAPDGVLRGELATAWRSASAGKSWDIDLIPEARFHDGRPVTARDAAASLRTLGQDTLSDATAIEAVDDTRLRISLSDPDPALPLRLSDLSLAICPQDDVSGALQAGLGSGPYRVRRLESGRRFLGVRHDSARRAEQIAWADEVEIIAIPDADVRAEALRDGYVDVAALPTPQGLLGRGEFFYHPSTSDVALAARNEIGVPSVVGARAPLDDGRLARRWWLI